MRREMAFSLVASSFLTLILAGLAFVIASEAQLQGVVVGVNEGDWVKYGKISATWESEQMEPDPELVALNNTLWFQNEVSYVKDTLIRFEQTTRFKNETQKTSVLRLDVYDGAGNGSLMLVSSGLSAGYILYPASASQLWINETVTRAYNGVTREVNHLNITTTQLTGDDPPNIVHFSINHYWDKATGVLTERFGSGTYVDQTGSQIASWTRSDKIVETNLWSPEEPPSDGQDGEANEFPYAIAGVVAVIVVVVGVWLFWPRKKRLKTRRTRKRR